MRNATTRLAAFFLLAILISGGCVMTEDGRTDVERTVARIDAVADAVVEFYPDLESTIAPIRTLLDEALADGELNRADLIPALRAARDVYIARLIDDEDLDEETLEDRIRQARAIESILRALVA